MFVSVLDVQNWDQLLAVHIILFISKCMGTDELRSPQQNPYFIKKGQKVKAGVISLLPILMIFG